MPEWITEVMYLEEFTIKPGIAWFRSKQKMKKLSLPIYSGLVIFQHKLTYKLTIMNKQIILQLLGLDYINGRYICQQAEISPIKWQNVKRGYVLDFTSEESERILKVFNTISEKIVRFMKWSSLSILSELLQSEFMILRPLISNVSKTEYDRILRWKRGESDLYDAELKIIKSALENLQKELRQIKVKP